MYKIAFIGFPNVGKTYYINQLCNTFMKVANYAGVSVEAQEVLMSHEGRELLFIDLPGIYDLQQTSGEETYTKEYIQSKPIDVIVNVVDYRDLHRQLKLSEQLKKLGKKMIILLSFTPKGIQKENILALQNVVKVDVVYPGYQQTRLLSHLLNLGKCNQDGIDVNALNIKKEMNIERLDRILLHRIWGIVCMLCILVGSMYILFLISEPFVFLFSFFPVFSFIPFLFFLFCFIAFIEESGYITRIAFLMDPVMRIFNLSGKSVIPIFVGYSCNVAALMSARMIDDKKERIASVCMIPFITCSAKLPVFLLFTSVFFANKQVLVLVVLYAVSLFMALLVASFITRKHEAIFIVELPPYQFPKIKIVLKKAFYEIKDFFIKVCKVLIVSTLIFSFVFIDVSLFFKGLPFVDNTFLQNALFYSILSKENIILYFSSIDIHVQTFVSNLFTNPHIELKVLCYLLYLSMSIPCLSTMVTMYKEYGIKVLCLSITLMLIIPYVFSSIAYSILVNV